MTELSDMQKMLAAMEALRTQMNTQFAVMRTDMMDMERRLRNEISGAHENLEEDPRVSGGLFD